MAGVSARRFCGIAFVQREGRWEVGRGGEMLLVPALPLMYPHVASDLLSRRSALICAGSVMSGMAARVG